jgi:hypothetical protein
VWLLGCLMLLSNWWAMAAAGAASYPPALGCGVSGVASAGSVLSVRGIGFGAGSRVLVSVDGRSTGTVRADPAGSFDAFFSASWPGGTPAAGATVTASAAECSATGGLTIENPQDDMGNPGLPSTGPGPGSAAGQPGAAAATKHPETRRPPASPANPEPVPPARQPEPIAAAIPSIPVTGLPPQLFLGLAGAVMLAGAAMTGLTGRLGHRGRRPTLSEISVASTHPRKPDIA